MIGSRSSGYSKEEDKFLCQIYIEISRDPFMGISQDQFWDRVLEAYKNGKIAIKSDRSKKSLQCRLQTIEKATKKLHACIKQCEIRRLSGASSDDILDQAKEMLMQDPKFKSGWKFDHVWNIIKNFEKFKDDAIPTKKASNLCGFGSKSLESENHISDSAIQASPGSSSFSLNLDEEDDIFGGSPSQRKSEIKKSKMKRKISDQTSYIKTLEEGHKQLLEQLKKTSAQRQQHLELQSKNFAFKEFKEENKFLFQNLNSIEDPNIRIYIQSEQARILRKRAYQQAPLASTSFGQYCNNTNGSGSGSTRLLDQ